MKQLYQALNLHEVDPLGLAIYVGFMLLAFVLALPAGWDREKETRTMGVRTFPLVAVASAGFVLIGRAIVGDDSAAHARILQGLMTGIGFLGGGAILKDGDRVRGTATAASIWATAGIGAATAHGRIEIAIVLSLVCFALLRYMKPFSKQVEHGAEALADEAKGLTGSSADDDAS